MENNTLDKDKFIREKMFEDSSSPLRKYMRLVIGRESIPGLLKYELVTCLLGPLPGALGLALRKIFYPCLFPKIGKGVVFGRNVTIRNPQAIELGDNVIIDDYALLDGRVPGEDGIRIGDKCIIGRHATLTAKSGPIVIGDNCSIGASSVISSQGGIFIEDWVQMAGECKIVGGLFTFDDSAQNTWKFQRHSKGSIRIGEHCFIGGGAMVVDDVTVGRCSMVGSGSIVVQSLPDYSTFVPRPGMIIGKTNQQKQ